MASAKNNPLARIINFTSEVKPEEFRKVSLAFLLVLLLMCAYYIMRPMRDGLASDWTDAEVSFLWTLNFFISMAATVLYGLVISKIRFHLLVPSVYGFFGISFLIFYSGMQLSEKKIWFDQAFYVWVSVFSLFNISVFWSFASEVFSVDQSTRLFPLIGAGASLGAIMGPSIPTLLTGIIGTEQLLFIACILILLAIPIVIVIQNEGHVPEKGKPLKRDTSSIGGNPFAGFQRFLNNPHLIKIAVFIVLYTMISSIIYFFQKNLLEEFDLVQRTEILAAVDWCVNTLTFVVALFLSGRIVNTFGMALALSVVPMAVCGGMLLLVVTTTLAVVLCLQVIRRAGNYALTRPARERLFTKVSREDRFKTKPVIDILAYRGGDMVTSWAFAGLSEGIGLGLSVMALTGAFIAFVWGLVALALGSRFERTSSCSNR